MAHADIDPRPSPAAPPDPRRIKAGIMPLFSTWIYLCEDGPTQLNERLTDLAHRLMQDDRNATRRIFPAWLEHRVEPFDGPGERISIAFNALNP